MTVTTRAAKDQLSRASREISASGALIQPPEG